MTSKSEQTTEIMVGMDDSPQSAAALRWAAAYAIQRGAQLRLVHVWELNAPAMYGTTVALREEITQDARSSLTRLASDVLGRTFTTGTWSLDVVEGPIGPTLTRLAEGSDLLVLGTGEHTGVHRLTPGSVSHYCLSHARCPVVAVPAPARPRGGAESTRDEQEPVVGPMS